MNIQPVSFSTPLRRPQRAAAPASPDQVELSAARPAAFSALPASAAAAAAVGGPTGAALSRWADGVEFRQRRFWFFWKGVDASQAEESARQGKRVDLRATNGSWVRTDAAEELEQARYFYGSAPAPAEAELAGALKNLAGRVEPYGAYRELTTGDAPRVMVQLEHRAMGVENGEEALLADFLTGGPQHAGISDPAMARGLRQLEQGNFAYSGDPAEHYRYQDRWLELSYRQVDLGQRDIQTDLGPVRSQLDALAERFPKNLERAFAFVEQNPAPGTPEQKALTLEKLGQSSLYQAVLQRAEKQPDRLPELLETGRAALDWAHGRDDQALELWKVCQDQSLPLTAEDGALLTQLGGDARAYPRLAAATPAQKKVLSALLAGPDKTAGFKGDWKPVDHPQLGRVFDDSPGTDYALNCRSQLTSPTFSLAGLRDCKLSFHREHELEQNYDFVTLEGSRDGRAFTELQRFTGRCGVTATEVDLSAYDGQDLTLRWNLSSDDQVNEGGFRFGRISLRGRDEQGALRSVFSLDSAGVSSDEVVRLTLSQPDPAWMEDASRRLGDFRSAAALARALDGRQLQADYGEQTRALTELAEQVGVEQATALWPRLQGDWARAAERAALLDQLSQRLGDPSLTPGLLDRNLSLDEAHTLSKLAARLSERPAGWEFEGRWTVDGPALAHGPYENNANSSLTSPLVDLGPAPRLELETKLSLEANYDFLNLEIQPGGSGPWKPIGRLTGRSDWQEQRYDLSAYANQKARVRFRLQSDDQAPDQGCALRAVRMGALEFDRGQGTLAQLAELATRGDSAALARVDRLAADHPPAAALTLAVALGPKEDEQRLSELATRVGVDRACALWPEVKTFQPALVAHRLEQTARMTEVAGNGQSRPMAVKLLKAGVDPTLLEDLMTRPGSDPGFRLEKGWKETARGYERPYSTNDKSALVTPWLDLAGGSKASLVLRHNYGLESNYDFVHLQASRDGANWENLASFTGSCSDETRLFDLSAYDGQRVQLRLQLVGDDQTCDRGYTLAGMHVSNSAGPLLGFEKSPMQADQLVDALVKNPAALARVDELARTTGSPRAALSLWSQAAGGDVKVLAELTASLGPVAAAQLYLPGKPAGPLLDSFHTAGRLAAEAGQKLDLSSQLKLARKLEGASLSAAERADLDALVGREADLSGWKLDKGWLGAFVDGSGFGLSCPSYPLNANLSAQTPDLDLTGLQGSRLRLRLGGSVEQNYDFLDIEVRGAGGKWETLQRLTGRFDPAQERQLDLSRFDGQKVGLRFRLSSDDQQSDTGPQLAQVLVTGWRGEQPEVALRLDSGPHTMLHLVDQFDQLPAADRTRRLASTRALAESLGSSSAALVASGWLTTGTDSERQAASELAGSVGVRQAGAMWPQLAGAPDPVAAVRRSVFLSEQAAALEVKLQLEPSEKSRADFVAALLDQGCEASHFTRLQDLLEMTSQPPAGLQLTDWVRRADGTLSDNSGSGYAVNANKSLMLPAGDQLNLTMAYDLENGYDFLKLEGLQHGEWVELDSLTGSSGFVDKSWDLRGRGTEFRLRLQADDQGQQAGVRIQALQLGDLQYDATRPTLEEIARALRCDRPEKLRDRLDLITRLTRVTGSLTAGVRGARALEPQEGSRDFNAAVEAMLLLTRRLGVKRAAELWPGLAVSSQGTPQERVELASRLELTARRWSPPASADLLAGVLGEVLGAGNEADRMLRALDVLLPEDGARVVAFLQEKRQPGGPLAHLTLGRALDEFMAVIGTRVLSDNLESVLELMLSRSARTVEEREDSLIVGGVVVKKKENEG